MPPRVIELNNENSGTMTVSLGDNVGSELLPLMLVDVDTLSLSVLLLVGIVACTFVFVIAVFVG